MVKLMHFLNLKAGVLRILIAFLIHQSQDHILIQWVIQIVLVSQMIYRIARLLVMIFAKIVDKQILILMTLQNLLRMITYAVL